MAVRILGRLQWESIDDMPPVSFASLLYRAYKEPQHAQFGHEDWINGSIPSHHVF